ncbi:hypothetical protein CYLTODRAFT_166380 [Cylindrobasidium torrendii FP15055 ss-10]|uniref:Uncharacterized protein n=1 Tax=Cylindrobasidium torrendii FP15055 ss-10 TaxID=1314674 RepID=A0A0D7AXQ9_9AGAR|nr:hypothetical protein CYLTODRAFT_166380 [Cylindrobasidium torrendii FP15055 ss-10]
MEVRKADFESEIEVTPTTSHFPIIALIIRRQNANNNASIANVITIHGYGTHHALSTHMYEYVHIMFLLPFGLASFEEPHFIALSPHDARDPSGIRSPWTTSQGFYDYKARHRAIWSRSISSHYPGITGGCWLSASLRRAEYGHRARSTSPTGTAKQMFGCVHRAISAISMLSPCSHVLAEETVRHI